MEEQTGEQIMLNKMSHLTRMKGFQLNKYCALQLSGCRDWGRKDSDDWGKGWGDDGGWSENASPIKSQTKEVEK